jgi:hypothetical protein
MLSGGGGEGGKRGGGGGGKGGGRDNLIYTAAGCLWYTHTRVLALIGVLPSLEKRGEACFVLSREFEKTSPALGSSRRCSAARFCQFQLLVYCICAQTTVLT